FAGDLADPVAAGRDLGERPLDLAQALAIVVREPDGVVLLARLLGGVDLFDRLVGVALARDRLFVLQPAAQLGAQLLQPVLQARHLLLAQPGGVLHSGVLRRRNMAPAAPQSMGRGRGGSGGAAVRARPTAARARRAAG